MSTGGGEGADRARSLNLGIVYAMPLESPAPDTTPDECGKPLRALGNCTVARSGIGGVNAQRAVRALHRAGVDAILSWGCAAGLDPAISPGTMLLPLAMIDLEGEKIPVDRALHSELCRRLAGCATVHTGVCMSSDDPVQSRQHKAALHRQFGAQGIDMESAAIAWAAHRCGLPFAAVRVILDPAGQSLPRTAVAGLQRDGSFAIRRGLQCLVRHPAEVIDLTQLALNAYRARRSLLRAGRCLDSRAGR